jgi:hypothetical protein
VPREAEPEAEVEGGRRRTGGWSDGGTSWPRPSPPSLSSARRSSRFTVSSLTPDLGRPHQDGRQARRPHPRHQDVLAPLRGGRDAHRRPSVHCRGA